MCRNIKLLYNFEPPASDDEIVASALQFVRKVSGMREPSQANREPFERAVAEVAQTTRRLFADLTTSAAPRSREAEARRARERGRRRQEQLRRQLLGETAPARSR